LLLVEGRYSIAMVQKKANQKANTSKAGGANRQAVPDVDLAHLGHGLKKYVEGLGVDAAFKLEEYHSLAATNAVNGAALVKLESLVMAMLKVAPRGHIKYSDLKKAVSSCIAATQSLWKSISQCFPGKSTDEVSGDLADNLMTVLNHVRRLQNHDRFGQAIYKLSAWQVDVLAKLRDSFGGLDDDDEIGGIALAEVATLAYSSDAESIPATQDLVDMLGGMDLTPKKQTGRGSSSSSGILLRAALDSSPVPCTKADIYAGMALAEEAKVSKKPAASKGTCKKFAAADISAGMEPASSASSSKQPAASKGTCKKPAAKPRKTVSLSMDMKFEPGSLSLMTYPTGAVAIRMKTGLKKQLLQINLPGNSAAENKAEAEKLKSELEAGQTLGYVVAEKAKLMAK
jgi:DNA uptake protein ComE-like DNA-binding protein